MGNFLQRGTTYAANSQVNSANLMALVDDATILATAISGRADIGAAAFGNKHLVEDAGTLKYETNQEIYDLLIQPGAVIQMATFEDGSVFNTTAEIPLDDTKPQITEGAQLLTLNFTPRYATSKILGLFSCNACQSVDNGIIIAAAFRTGNAYSLATDFHFQPGAAVYRPSRIVLMFQDAPNSVSAQTYSIRIGRQTGGTGTVSVNSYGGGAIFNNTLISRLVLQEIKQ